MTEKESLDVIAEQYPFLKDDGGRGVLRPMFPDRFLNLSPKEIQAMVDMMPEGYDDDLFDIHPPLNSDPISCNNDADPDGLI